MENLIGLIIVVAIIYIAITRMFPENPLVVRLSALVGGGAAVYLEEILAALGLG